MPVTQYRLQVLQQLSSKFRIQQQVYAPAKLPKLSYITQPCFVTYNLIKRFVYEIEDMDICVRFTRMVGFGK
jgi:hypothetical protein